jgi:hypothetical protein
MLTFTRLPDGGVNIVPALPSPTVYLDYSVIVNLAGTSAGERLRKNICGGGTLYLSWAHILELFSLGFGPTFQKVVTYLKAFGSHFIVIDADPNRVIQREDDWKPGLQNPAIDLDFLALLAAKWNDRDEVSPAILLDYMAGYQSLFRELQDRHVKYKTNIKGIFDAQRQIYRTDKTKKAQLDAAVYTFAPPFVTSKVNLELARECIRTNEQFNPSDSLDFLHAVVSIAYCQYVVLDKKWARRSNAVKLPETQVARVFNGTEIESLLAALDRAEQYWRVVRGLIERRPKRVP